MYTQSQQGILPNISAPTEQIDALFQNTLVFHANYTSKVKVNVNQGGTSSTKTYSLAQVCILNAIYDAGTVCTVVGEDVPALKAGAYRDFETIYKTSQFFGAFVSFWNKSDRVIYFTNGSIIEFKSYEGITDASSGKRDYLFVNEANSITHEIYWQLAIRTRKRIYLDYNPTAKFWVHSELLGQEGVRLIISDHRFNPFLTEEQHAEIEGIKDKGRRRVYARGLTGKVDGLVFNNWQKIPDSDFPKDETFFAGLDFGYTNDPTAGVKIVRINDSIYLHEMFYTPGMPAKNIVQDLKANGFTSKNRVYCEHDSDMIAELRRLQVMAWPARKGNGSINAGIVKLKEFKVFYTASSKNIDNEVSKYMWDKDPQTGKFTNTPIDQYNHLMDAIRYGVYTHYFRSPK